MLSDPGLSLWAATIKSTSKISLPSFKPVSQWNTVRVWLKVHLNNQSLGVITLKGHILSKYWPCENVTLWHSRWGNNLLLPLLFYCHCSWASVRSSTNSQHNPLYSFNRGKTPNLKHLCDCSQFYCQNQPFLTDYLLLCFPGRAGPPFCHWQLHRDQAEELLLSDAEQSLLQVPPHFTAGGCPQPLLSLDQQRWIWWHGRKEKTKLFDRKSYRKVRPLQVGFTAALREGCSPDQESIPTPHAIFKHLLVTSVETEIRMPEIPFLCLFLLSYILQFPCAHSASEACR